jgi:hypothetical protein
MHTHIEDTQRLVTEVSSTPYRKQKLPESYKGLEKVSFTLQAIILKDKTKNCRRLKK